MRGSIIQQIFRVVTDTHSSATKKNREWQEKLPIVVLKAEEIMYSKANSETEYMDLGTLWDRVNDAVNTIIRRDESTETGELLPPCIEAALNLGCVPVRASRSQRHNNPRSYLTHRTQEPTSVSPRGLDNAVSERCPQLPPPSVGNQLTFGRLNMDSTHLASDSDRHVTQNNSLATTRNFHFPYENIPLGGNQSMTVETNTPLNFGSVYPLYYGTHFQNEESHLGFQMPETANANSVFVGTPVGTSIAEPSEMGIILQNLFSSDGTENVLNKNAQENFRGTCGKEPVAECDLSLKLGLFSDPCMRKEKFSAPDTEDVGSSSSQEGAKVSGLSPGKSKGFCFFPSETANSPFGSCSNKWNSGDEGQNMDATVRKRKAPFNNDLEGGQFFLPPEIRSDHFTGRI